MPGLVSELPKGFGMSLTAAWALVTNVPKNRQTAKTRKDVGRNATCQFTPRSSSPDARKEHHGTAISGALRRRFYLSAVSAVLMSAGR